jgi:hypothetical protein
VIHVEKPLNFDATYAPATPNASTIKMIVLLAALLAYAAGFVILYPIVASSVEKSVSEGNDPALMQFVAP